jgi:hypothetical protein
MVTYVRTSRYLGDSQCKNPTLARLAETACRQFNGIMGETRQLLRWRWEVGDGFLSQRAAAHIAKVGRASHSNVSCRHIAGHRDQPVGRRRIVTGDRNNSALGSQRCRLKANRHGRGITRLNHNREIDHRWHQKLTGTGGNVADTQRAAASVVDGQT